jgi:hypothetical protein
MELDTHDGNLDLEICCKESLYGLHMKQLGEKANQKTYSLLKEKVYYKESEIVMCANQPAILTKVWRDDKNEIILVLSDMTGGVLFKECLIPEDDCMMPFTPCYDKCGQLLRFLKVTNGDKKDTK